MVVLPFDVCSLEGLSDTDLETTAVEASSDPLDRAVLGLLVLMSAPVGRLAEAQKEAATPPSQTYPTDAPRNQPRPNRQSVPVLITPRAIDGPVPDPRHHPGPAVDAIPRD